MYPQENHLFILGVLHPKTKHGLTRSRSIANEFFPKSACLPFVAYTVNLKIVHIIFVAFIKNEKKRRKCTHMYGVGFLLLLFFYLIGFK